MSGHPCCDLWERLAPGRPCGACSASRAYWAKNAHRRPPAPIGYDTDAAWSCDTCGLTDAGYERLVSFGFTPHPCLNCKAHFADAFGITLRELGFDMETLT